MDFDLYQSFFVHKTESLIKNQTNLPKKTYCDLLVDLFEERSFKERTLYNYWLHKYKNVHTQM